MHHLVYKITNQLNGKIYIGIHKTKNIDDGYMGSGVILKRAQAKYGIDNFVKEILFDFDSKEEMFAKEAELVNEEFVNRSDTYNAKLGGEGGWDHVDGGSNSKEHYSAFQAAGNSRYREALSLNPEKYHDKIVNAASIGREALKTKYPEGVWKGKTHSDETKLQMSKSGSGTKNSQYGTCWIYSLEEKRSIKISSVDLETWIEKGWNKGRKLKF